MQTDPQTAVLYIYRLIQLSIAEMIIICITQSTAYSHINLPGWVSILLGGLLKPVPLIAVV
jgi:hypothetical protein